MTIVRTSWLEGKPFLLYFIVGISDLDIANILLEIIIFDRSTHVPLKHLNYFRTPEDGFLRQLKTEYQRLSK